MEDNPDFPRESRSYILLGMEIGFFTVTTFIIFSRIYIRARVSKAIGWDDYLAVAAFATLIVNTSLDFMAELNGAGTSMDQLTIEQIRRFFTLSPVGLLLYFVVAGLVRLSILAFLPRLNKERWYMRCVWILGIVIVAVTLAAFFYVLTECKPIIDLFSPDRPMKNCRPQKYEADVMYIHGISGVVIDLTLFSLPIWVIRQNMTISKKIIQVSLVFAVGLFAIIVGIVRVVVLFKTNYAINTTYKIFWVGMWTMIELHVGLWCGSFPALQPLVRLVAYKLNLTSHDSSNKLSGNTNAFASPDDDRPDGNLYMRQGSASQQSTGSSAGGILGRGGNTSSGESTTEIVEMERVNDLRGTRMFMDMRVSIENGKRSYVRERTEFKEPWDAV